VQSSLGDQLDSDSLADHSPAAVAAVAAAAAAEAREKAGHSAELYPGGYEHGRVHAERIVAVLAATSVDNADNGCILGQSPLPGNVVHSSLLK